MLWHFSKRQAGEASNVRQSADTEKACVEEGEECSNGMLHEAEAIAPVESHEGRDVHLVAA